MAPLFLSRRQRYNTQILRQLEEGARDIDDLHTHEIVDGYSSPPTKNQIEPYKPPLEVLYQEIERRLSSGSA